VTNQDRNKAWGFVLFGDDLRAEVGGKLSLMGMYQADMFFPENMPLPIAMPKLVLMIMYYEIHGSLQEDISFKITYGAESTILAEMPISRKDIDAGQAQAQVTQENPTEDSERIFNIRMPAVLSPFVIEKLGRLRVRAHYSDGKILKLGSIAVRQVPETEFQSMLGIKPTQ
jgi:hypothetical protein